MYLMEANGQGSESLRDEAVAKAVSEWLVLEYR